jgi:solute carrier family 35 protein E3
MAYPVWALVIGSILTTVFLVMVNKIVFAGGFPFVLSLSTLHFVATYLVMLVLSKGYGAFDPKYLPFWTNFLVGAMGVGSICFMNYSLKFNSVGVYQMAKLCIIPVVLAHNALRGEFASRKVYATIAIVLLGVGAATVTDVELNPTGLMFAIAAVLSTSQYQIWQGSKQREAKLSDMQMTMSVSSSQIIIAGLLAVALEGEEVSAVLIGTELSPPHMNAELAMQILVSCLLAVSANAHSFALIGRTSPVTFQIVGHGKTCLIIIAGYLLFPLPSLEEFVYNAMGVAIAVLAVILYSNLKMNEGKNPDWCDLYAPKFCLDILAPSPSKALQEDGKPNDSVDVTYTKVPINSDLEKGKLKFYFFGPARICARENTNHKKYMTKANNQSDS